MADPTKPAAAAVTETTFDAHIFDWDGTAVPDRKTDARAVVARLEALSAAGIHAVVVSGTNVDNVYGQAPARPQGPGRLSLCLNRGSEVFAVTEDGPQLVSRREATAAENAALDAAADQVVAELADKGLVAEVVANRLNRRKIDLIPEPEWADPPKARIAELTEAVTARLAVVGLDGVAAVAALATAAARRAGLVDPKVTSDVKHVEIGLTDKSDSARWAARWLGTEGITGGLILVAGDEFGPIGGMAGSDSMMLVPELSRAVAVSVGVEPGGVPNAVEHLGGGPARWLELVDAQLRRHRGATRARS